jgi:hypothetical protein
MNTQLAKAIVEVIRAKWNPNMRELDSKDIYHELLAKSIEIPENDMSEILEKFKKAGVINGEGYKHPTAHGRHGAFVITAVNLELLDQLDFD